MSPPVNQKVDMKICRLCGINNKENIDIFNSKPISSKSEDLLTKILTVYPMVLYKNDPLPQYICPRCIGNVSTTYQHIQQVLRQQHKWMNLTRTVQPEHKYFHILNAVENSTDSTIHFIKSAYNIDINNVTIRKLLAKPQIENPNNNTINTNDKLNINETVVKNIKNKLESNGFTIKRIKIPPTNNISTDLNSQYNLDDTNEDNIVTCNYCQQKFSNLKILAQHQLIHLKVNANKVFQRRLLPKQSRRGRLITLNDTKCIRCLNCWRTFKDNKCILQHWCDGECEYYCSICGKEFPDSPQMLRDHITDEHEVNYRTITQFFMESQDKLLITKPADTTLSPIAPKTKSGYKKPPPKSCTKNDDGTITCKICHRVFDNFRSSNSHMRKHKPPAPRFGDPMSLNSTNLNNYVTQDDFNTQPSTSNYQYGYNNNPIAASLNLKSVRPNYDIIMNNGSLRGIKTKNIPNRHDFHNNYPTNIRQSYQNPITSIPDLTDDEDVIVPEVIMPVIKSEPMFDDNYDDIYGSLAIKSEPVDNSEECMEGDESRLCFICNENFSNLHDYELHAKYVHNIN